VPTPLLSEKKIRNFRAAVERLSLVICPSGRLVSSLLFRIFRKIFVAT
jgi:hypothetical protein